MKKNPPRRSEQMLADLERWQLELADELGIIEEVYHAHHPIGARPVLRSHHDRPTTRAKRHSHK